MASCPTFKPRSLCPCHGNILLWPVDVSCLFLFLISSMLISLQSDKNDGGYHHVNRWFKVDKLLSTQHILIPININKKCVILKSHSCFPISCLITVIGSLPSLLFLRSVYSLRIIPCKSSNLQMLYHRFYTPLSLVTILDSLAQPNSHEKVAGEISKWVDTVCSEISSRKPRIVTSQAKVGLSIGHPSSRS
jgi:Ulp1 family protease